jgi:hypothetical protein
MHLAVGPGQAKKTQGFKSRIHAAFFIGALMATVIAFSLEMQPCVGVEHHAD